MSLCVCVNRIMPSRSTNQTPRFAPLRFAPWRTGLTLLELIVALGILAVLSTLAVGALDPLADQSRYEATQRLLRELRNATVGDRSARQINGQLIVSGFVADTGSLPSILGDFTTKPAGVIDHSVQTFDSNRDLTDDVTLSSGWKGPYLHLGAGQTDILDGWGRAPLIDPDGGDFDFFSYGADTDSLAPEEGYLADLSEVIASSEYLSNVTFRLFEIDGGTGTRIDPSPSGTEQLGVLFYGANANGGTSGAIEERMLPIAAVGSFEASQANQVHGVVAARGVIWNDVDADQVIDSGETVIRSSYVHYLTLSGGMDVRVEMELR